MFIRLKTRKTPSGLSSYAYLVSSRHRKKGAKQKVNRYLGKVYSFQRLGSLAFQDYLQEDPISYIAKKSLKTSFYSLIRHELANHGFEKITLNKHRNSNVLVNLSTREVKEISTGKPVCVTMNDGFLTGYTLSKLLNFKAPEALNKEIGKDLAKRLLNSGVLLEEPVFIALFQRLQRDLSTS